MVVAHLLLAAALAPAALATPLKLRDVASYDGNPLADRQLFPNPYYTDEITNLAVPKLTGDLAAKAAKVAEVPTFAWL